MLLRELVVQLKKVSEMFPLSIHSKSEEGSMPDDISYSLTAANLLQMTVHNKSNSRFY